MFPTEDLSVSPDAVVLFAAGQPAVETGEFAAHGARRQNRYEHAWEIRDAYGYREFSAAEAEVRGFVAAWAWASLEGPRALFDRAVVRLIAHCHLWRIDRAVEYKASGRPLIEHGDGGVAHPPPGVLVPAEPVPVAVDAEHGARAARAVVSGLVQGAVVCVVVVEMPSSLPRVGCAAEAHAIWKGENGVTSELGDPSAVVRGAQAA